jgi:hypothetical protein
VIASLLVRRDYRLRDFASIHAARAIFDGAAPALARVAHRYFRDTEAGKTQFAVHLLNASRAGTESLKAQTAGRHRPILQQLEALESAKTPRRLWTKLTLQAMREQKRFAAQSDDALIKTIQRDIKAHFPPDKQ